MTRLSAIRAATAAAFLSATALAPVHADDEAVFPATLAGHALIPALSLITPPADAPADAMVSGKYAAGPARVDAVMSVEGNTGGLHGRRPTGIFYPFIGQPLQGFSGFAMERTPEGHIIALTDNGFGSKVNSFDTLLFFHHIDPDFETGAVEVADTFFLRDPNKVIPFRIAHEGTAERYLTGADFDLESIQVVGDEIFIGEEFGPYIIRTTLDGVVTGLYPTVMDGKELRSPDHPNLRVPAAAGEDFTVPRSGGYEGMALQPSTGLLWGMLEKPLLGEDGSAGPRVLPVLAFDPNTTEFTGAKFNFPLADGATAIGDFNFIDDTRALVIERDNGEGDPSLKCEGEAAPDCFPNPAMVKRVVLIDTASIDDNGNVRRIGHIDLMNIQDPDGKGRLETAAARDLTGIYTMPFFTIEDVMRVDEDHIIVGTDNNLPFSSGRQLDAAKDNEFLLLNVSEMLNAQ